MADTKKDSKKEFKNASAVENVVKAMRDITDIRAADRAMIESLFNGKRPYSVEEQEKYQIQINVNFGMGKRIMRDANTQVNAALLHPGIMFKATLERGQVDKRDEWSDVFTTEIHRPLQFGVSGRRYYFLMKSRTASICMHGIGALLWVNPFRWMPRFVPIEDLLIPTETLCDFTNLRYFGVNVYLTPGELVDMALGDKVQKGWNDKMVKEVLDSMEKVYNEGVPPTWRDQPSAMRQVHKENHGMYYSDAVPKIRCTWFFYQEVDEPNKWYRLLILREAYGEAKPGKDFLFDGSDKPFADDISQILGMQYGDNNLVAPLKYHTTRGLGTDLYAPVETDNRLRCQFVQAVFENLLMYFRIQDPSDRDRLKQIVLAQYGILPEGLNIVPQSDRHQINQAAVEEALAQMKDINQDSASSYLPGQSGTEKEMTAKEATIKLNQANVMVSGMLQSLYLQEAFIQQEIVRRFCKKGSGDKDVKEFQQRCIKQGIPEDLLYDDKAWRVTPERVLGGGDKTQAQQEAGWLWQNKEQLDPAVQPAVKRLVVGTLLNDWNKAKQLVPLAKVESTSGTQAAENVFGTLMTGNQTALRKGIDLQGYIGTLLRMMGSVVQRIMQTGGVSTMDELVGLATVAQNLQQHISALAADVKMKPLIKQFGDALGQILNEVKGIGQRTMEQRQAQQQAQMGDPAGAAKAKSAMLMAQTKAQIAQANAALKQKQKSIDFALDQQRQDLRLAAEIRRQDLQHHSEIAHANAQHLVDLLNEVRMSNAREVMTAKNGEK